ncbi:MAG: hypothetical protein SNJ74_02005 [Fimbriimonadaceae bacterium]
MTEIPTIWLWVSGLFFLFGTIAYGVAIVVAVRALKAVQELQPTVKRLTDRVESIGQKVDTLADSARTTVDDVGGRARLVAKNLEGVVSLSARRFESISQVVMMAGALLKLYQQVSAAKRSQSKPAASKTLDKAGKKRETT